MVKFYFLLSILLGLLLTGCDSTTFDSTASSGSNSSNNSDNSGGTDNSGGNNNSGGSQDPALIDMLNSLNLASGKEQYDQQCVTCHGSTGEGGSGGELLSCKNCDSIAQLTQEIHDTMPFANTSRCIDECAENIAGYIVNNFSTIVVQTPVDVAKKTTYELKNLKDTLRKFSVAAINRMPTEEEFALAETEAGFDSVVRNMMTEKAFGDWIKITYNDLLLTNKYKFIGVATLDLEHSTIGGRKRPLINRFAYLHNRDIFNGDMFGIAEKNVWYDSGCHNNLLSWSIQQEPLELVKYVAMNDRPIEEIITGKYRMVNYYSHRYMYYGERLDGTAFDPSDFIRKDWNLETFDIPQCVGTLWRQKVDSIPEEAKFYYDPNDFKPALIGPVATSVVGAHGGVTLGYDFSKYLPLSGVLTSELFLHRHRTNDSNRNRLRAAMVFKFFLDEDIGASQVNLLDSGDYEYPVLENPACTHCHDRLDPVAAAFFNWHEDAQYFPYTLVYTGTGGIFAQQARRYPQPDRSGMKTPGFGDYVVPEADFDNALQLVAEKIAGETRKYRSAMIRTLYAGLLGEYDNPAYFRSMYDEFEAAGVDTSNMKELVLALIKHPDYRIDGIQTKGEDFNENDVRSVRLVTAEIMVRRIKATTNLTWEKFENESLQVLYGGIDSDGNIKRFTEISGVSESLTESMAAEMSCKSVTNDFRKDMDKRLLFPNVEITDQPESQEAIARIKQNLIHLHKWMLQETLSEGDAELETTYQLFKSTYDFYKQSGDATLEERCQVTFDPEHKPERGRYFFWVPENRRITSDPNYTIRAWMAVMKYLMLDAKFLHE